MKTFTLGLKLSSETQFILTVLEEDIQKAKHEWARVTGHLDTNWNDSDGTYCYWPVVETKEKALTRKGGPLIFGY